jgi:hypothetical protein
MFSLLINEAHHQEDLWGMDIRGHVFSLYLWEKRNRHPLDRRMAGPQNLF